MKNRRTRSPSLDGSFNSSRFVPPQCGHDNRCALRNDFSNIKCGLNVSAAKEIHLNVDWKGFPRRIDFRIISQEANALRAANVAAPPNEFPPARTEKLFWTPLLAIAAAALCVEIPFFFFGTPSGHDVEFHLYSWLEVLSQWKQGIFFPRWAAMAHFGYGEPRFIFYPPASWMLGSILSAVFPWKFASDIYIWLALTLAGMSMFRLAGRWFSRRDAIFVGVFYAVNPYHLVIVYWRSSFAELLASCLVPLLFLLILRASEEGWRTLPALSLLLAAAWLTNAPAALMIHYSLALLIIIFAWQKRSMRLLWIGAAAVAIGACLAGFYLVPAIYEQRWVNIAEAISAGSRPQDNFLFVHTTDADHDRFNRIMSWVAVLEIVATLAAAAVAVKWRRAHREVWSALAGWAVACAVAMFSFSAVLWKFLPKLEFMQFPWRWLLCMSMILSILVAACLRRWWMRITVYAVGVIVIVAAWHRIQPPWWDNAADLKEMQDNMADRIGYEGTDEYTPTAAEPSAIDKNAANVVAIGTEKAVIDVTRWQAKSKEFTAETPTADQLVLRLFRYPAWKAEVNGQEVQTAVKQETGQMVIPVQRGTNHVQVTFTRTWDRTIGGWISAITAWCLLLWVALARNREPWGA